MDRVEACRDLLTTEAVLLEIGAAFRHPIHRTVAIETWDWMTNGTNCKVAAVSGSLLQRGIDLFRQRPDKAWSLTDCISFIVMADNQLTDALTCDHHFAQTGFRAHLLEPV